MRPRSTEKPVARTPNTPDARSPSSNTLPAGARRRTSSIAATATPVTAATIITAQKMLTSPPQGGVNIAARRAGGPPGQPASVVAAGVSFGEGSAPPGAAGPLPPPGRGGAVP